MQWQLNNFYREQSRSKSRYLVIVIVVAIVVGGGGVVVFCGGLVQ